MNGSFFFRDGEEGIGTIELRILPHGEVEVEETFVIELSILSGEMDVDPQAGSVTLKVLLYHGIHIILASFDNSNSKALFSKGNHHQTYLCLPNVFLYRR